VSGSRLIDLLLKKRNSHYAFFAALCPACYDQENEYLQSIQLHMGLGCGHVRQIFGYHGTLICCSYHYAEKYGWPYYWITVSVVFLVFPYKGEVLSRRTKAWFTTWSVTRSATVSYEWWKKVMPWGRGRLVCISSHLGFTYCRSIFSQILWRYGCWIINKDQLEYTAPTRFAFWGVH